MKNRFASAALACSAAVFVCAPAAHAQDHYCVGYGASGTDARGDVVGRDCIAGSGMVDEGKVDGHLVRGLLGLGYVSLAGLPKISDRIGYGLDARADLAILSNFARRAPHRAGFVLYDSFYLDVLLGKMTSDPVSWGKQGDEGAILATGSFGYALLAGWSTGGASIAGGVDFGWFMTHIGGSDSDPMMTGTRPWVVRASAYVGDVKVVASAWKTLALGDSDRMGAELGLPVSTKPFWIGVRVDSFDTSVDPPTPGNAPPVSARLTQVTLGLRVCGSWGICP